ncbi:hypothetical protein PHMEG_00035282, partial [Phytophthora megakarya]
MEDAVLRQHAQPYTVFHCLYGFYCLGLPLKELARIYAQSVRTIGNWIKVYESTGTYQRAESSTVRKFSSAHQQWLCDFFADHPLAYFDEAQDAFVRAYYLSISTASVWRLIHNAGLTRKALERRAMHIKELDCRLTTGGRSKSADSHSKGRRSRFERKPRISVLAFIGVTGVIDAFNTPGTFDRVEFFNAVETLPIRCKAMSFSILAPIPFGFWMRDPGIIYFLHSIGIVPIFLTAYCPFINPIEYLFGYIKKCFQRHYVESSGRDLLPFVMETFNRLSDSLCQRYLIIAVGRFKVTGVTHPLAQRKCAGV